MSRRPKYGEKKNHENQFFNTLQYTSLLKYANQCIKCHKFRFHLFFSKSISTYGIMIIAFYHQTKTPIGFWCRRELNPRSLIQLSETLSVELIRTHKKIGFDGIINGKLKS